MTSLSVSGDTIFASTQETILLVNPTGKIINEWGPYEDSCIITSVSSNKYFIAFGDAGNKLVFIVKKTGELQKIIGHSGSEFIIPSPYFDVALTTDNKLIVANTGRRRVETRTIDGNMISFFGEPGTAPDSFCGCCNPAHFALLADGLVTAEKGINRIKIVNKKGEFVEFVSSVNGFSASIPLDIAAFNDNIIYAANPSDSKLYVFVNKGKQMKRKDFLVRIMRYLLLSLLAVVVLLLGNKIVSGENCSKCPANGICSGKSDCYKY